MGEYPIIDENTFLTTGEFESGERYKEKIEELIEDLGIENKARFLGYKKGKELYELYRNAAIYYLPTKNDLGTWTFVESMASGTPVVSKKNPGTETMVTDGKHGFLRDTKQGQRKAIEKLLANDELYAEIQKTVWKEPKSTNGAMLNLNGEIYSKRR